MVHLDSEPSLRVGLLASDGPVGLELKGAFKTGDGQTLTGGKLVIESDPSGVAITGEQTLASASQIRLSPDNLDECRFTVDGITIGIDFHWEQKESQSFQGHIEAARAGDVIQIVNEVPIESYLAGVISSEMSASCPGELLRAHAVVSRSWLLAQVRGRPLPQLNEDAAPARPANAAATTEDAASLVRWYGRESHQGFDVCADDHCQRYQGTGKAFSGAVFDAIRDTRGTVLVFEEEICDARYSKCCGGMTERYSAAWDDKDVPYLAPIYDGPDGARSASFTLPLTTEQNAGRWIRSSPPAYCDTQSEALLSTILTGFDQKTRDFYRWEVIYDSKELSDLVARKLDLDFGQITDLVPIERGDSGRIVTLRIVGEKRSLIIGKELEVRRALSLSHLYSSAFVVEKEETSDGRVEFKLIGAGWGHGVGLCQIGAAVMADSGIGYHDILAHYFPGAQVMRIY